MNALDVKKQGYLRRLKTQKRRYFVLRTISVLGKPRLEYYESEKKFRSNCPPKRVIHLASCFNIAQKDDTKHEFVFVLYTREDVFGLICDSKDELQSWLDALLNEQGASSNLQGNDYLSDNVPGDIQLPALRRDYVASVSHASSWPVTVKPRGLGTSKHLAGSYNLKLADHTLSLHKISSDVVVADFHLTIVRRCGHTDCFFFMEVGRSSVTGAGELWMQVEDPILAKNLHEVVLMSMQTLSSDGYSSMSRHRCHSGGHKPRPSSLMLLTPPRNRSDTLPDPAATPPGQDGPPSPTKALTPDQSSPSGGKRSAMFQRLWSVGKRKSEVFDFSPKLFSRRTQSKSLSIDPCPGGLLGRAQSVDFSNLFGALPSSPETPEERDVGFDAQEPQRTSSNSSGSSGRSWDQSLPRNFPYIDEERDSKTLTSSSRPPEMADEGYDSTARDDNTPDEGPTLDDDTDDKTTRDDKTLKRETNETQEQEQQDKDKTSSFEDKSVEGKQSGISQRNRSGYEDMSGNLSHYDVTQQPHDVSEQLFDVTYQPDDEDDYVNVRQDATSNSTPNSLERDIFPSRSSPSMQRRTSEPPRSESPILEQLHLKSKSSPKQRRTSEPVAAMSNEFLELVTIKNSPSSSPRRTKKGTSANATIMEHLGSPPENTSPSHPPGERRRVRGNDEYVEMNPFAKYHTYVNLDPKEGFKHQEESAYMNLRPGDYHGTQTECEEHDYMNFKPGQFSEGAAVEEQPPSYVNFQPGNINRSDSKSPRQKPKHQYENLHLNGAPIGGNESEFSDYMNVSPRRHHSDKTHSKRKTIPRRTAALPGRHGRRESEPVGLKGMSDEENGLLFLDFSGNSSRPSKDLNYISLDLSKKEPSTKSSPKKRPPDVNTSLNAWSLNPRPKSAPISTTSYAEIDFTRSHGLRQAIIDHKKPKTPKE